MQHNFRVMHRCVTCERVFAYACVWWHVRLSAFFSSSLRGEPHLVLQLASGIAMGMHFTDQELDDMHQWKSVGKTPLQICEKMTAARQKRGLRAPDITAVRRALKGKPFKRSTVETRGRKRSLTDANLKALDRARERPVTKARPSTWACFPLGPPTATGHS